MNQCCARGLQRPVLCLFICVSILLLHGLASAATFCVSSAAELAAALLTAQGNGAADVIQVVQGTYSGAFVYSSTEQFSLAIKGGYVAGCASRIENPSNTVLDGMSAGTVLALASSRPADFAVDGVTLQNGSATTGNGGGLFASPSGGELTLTNTTTSGNTARVNGGGIYVTGAATTTLTNSTISGNSSGNGGGGMYVVDGTTVTLTDATISGNTASVGGGIYASVYLSRPSTITLTNSIIRGNKALGAHSGGGYLNADRAILTNTTIDKNEAGCGGGGTRACCR